MPGGPLTLGQLDRPCPTLSASSPGGGGYWLFGFGYPLLDLRPPPILRFWPLLICHLSINAPHFCNISEPLPKMGTCNKRLYLKHLIMKVCLYFACNKDFISCFKGHNVKACPFRDVPPLQNWRVWGGHRSSVSAFTAIAFGVGFTVDTQTWGKYPPGLQVLVLDSWNDNDMVVSTVVA